MHIPRDMLINENAYNKGILNLSLVLGNLNVYRRSKRISQIIHSKESTSSFSLSSNLKNKYNIHVS